MEPVCLVRSVEDERMIYLLIREQEQEDAIAANPARLKTGRATVDDGDGSELAGMPGVQFQRCGGGRRIIRKKI